MIFKLILVTIMIICERGMRGLNMFAGWTVFFTWIITIGMIKAYQFPIPDFESPWLYLQAQAGASKATMKVMHGLNEVPIFVDVQVKSLDSPNKGYIFQAIGALPRDDDAAEPFGGVTYIYDSTQIIVCAPQHANGGNTSYAIYTENGDFYAGVNNQSSYNVEVRIRAWKKSSLPPADFERTGMHMTAWNISNMSDVYMDVQHGLNEYPAFIIVRMNLTDVRGKLTAMSDAVGANFVVYTAGLYRQNYHIVHGVSKERIRVWIDSQNWAYIYAGGDGYAVNFAAKEGDLEMYAWKSTSMNEQEYSQTALGPDDPSETFEVPYRNIVQNPLTRAWARSNTGPNAGYLFPGSGAMAFGRTISDSICSYGGLVYAYNFVNMRFWRPTNATNGGLICVSNFFGNGTNSERSLDAEIIMRSWGVKSKRNSHKWTVEVPQDKCIRTKPKN